MAKQGDVGVNSDNGNDIYANISPMGVKRVI